MWRVVCNRCKGRGHFGRNCPCKNTPSTFEADLDFEAEAEAARAQRGDVRWISVHDDELQRSQPRIQAHGTNTARGTGQRAQNPHREARFIGRYSASAVQSPQQVSSVIRGKPARWGVLVAHVGKFCRCSAGGTSRGKLGRGQRARRRPLAGSGAPPCTPPVAVPKCEKVDLVCGSGAIQGEVR
jgi:hypothetical protein